MRFSTTVLVAIQASMGLAHAIPSPSTKYLDKIDNLIDEDHEKRGSLTGFRKKFLKGYELARSTTRHTFLVPEDEGHESKKHRHDNEHHHDHESEDRYNMKNKYEPQRHHVSEKPHSKTHHPKEDYNHEEHYHHSESYDNPKTRYHHSDYNYETEYPSKEHEYKKDYPTESPDSSDDRYSLNEHDFDKYFFKDHGVSSKEYESDDIGDSQGIPFKRWASNGDIMRQWWHPGQPKEYYRDANKEQTHSYKYEAEPRLPDTTGPREFKHNAKEHYKKPDYEKEDEKVYGPESQEKYHKQEHYEKNEGSTKLKGFYEFNFGHNPEEGKFLDDESHTTKHGGSGKLEEITFKKYYPKKSDKEDKEGDPNTAKKYGYRQYYPKKHSSSDEYKMDHHKKGKNEAYDSEEDKKHEYKKVHYPTQHEPKENTKFYRKQEVGQEDHGYKAKPYLKEHQTHYYDEPGYENVVPGFMWAGPGTVTKTPCASKEGCPYGHWHMLEPKDGEHRRIGITGTNIVVEPDYSRPDYKEDMVNHVLPGYEKVIPGFEWAGPGRVTEVPCPSVTDCPQGGWFMLAPRYGEHRRIAMNYPKNTPTPHPHPHPQPHSTRHFHQPDYKPRSPVRYEGRAHEKDNDEDEGEYKLIHRHSSHMGKRSIEARTPCSKKKDVKVKKLDPNKPLPRLSTTQLMNFEGLSSEKRAEIVSKYPWMDEELKKEFPTYKELTPRLITKLNEFWGTILLDRGANQLFIEAIKRKPRFVPRKRATPELGEGESNKIEALSKRADPVLSEDQIKRIEAAAPLLRRIVAGRLGFDPRVTEELATARGKFSADLIAKLNKEYARIMSDPKYKDLREKYLPDSKKAKRGEDIQKKYRLDKEQIQTIENTSPLLRRTLCEYCDVNMRLTSELVNAPTPFSKELIEKLNVEYTRVMNDFHFWRLRERFVDAPRFQKEKKAKEAKEAEEACKACKAKEVKEANEAREDKEAEKARKAKKFREAQRFCKAKEAKEAQQASKPISKRSEPQLSEKAIKKIEGLSYPIRRIVAKKLDLDPKLTAELVKTDKLSDNLIEKLNVEYGRIKNDPKYKDILDKFLSSSKRAEAEPDLSEAFSEAIVARMLRTDERTRQMAADILEMDPKIAKELVYSERLTPQLLEKLYGEWLRVKDDPKYAYAIRKLMKSTYKRSGDGIYKRRGDGKDYFGCSVDDFYAFTDMPSEERKKWLMERGTKEKTAEELADIERWTQADLEKLEAEFIRFKSITKYRRLHYKNPYIDPGVDRKVKRESEAPGITQEQLEKIIGMSSSARKIAALQLGISQELSEEVAYADTFSPELIKKLDKEYRRIKSDPKYNAVLKKFGNNKTKRDSYHKELTEQQLDKILHMKKSERRLIAETLNFKKDLAEEFIDCEEFTPHLVKTLNEVYSQVKGGRSYNKLKELFSDHEKRQLVPSTMNISQTERDPDWEVNLSPQFNSVQGLAEQFIKRLGEMIHDKVEEAKKQLKQQSVDDSAKKNKAPKGESSDAQQATVDTEATPSFNATKALDELIAGNSNKTVSSQNATGLTAPQAISNLNTTELLEPRDTASQNVTEIAADQPASNQTSTDSLQDKLEQSKKNGWCNEFLGGLENTLKEPVEAAKKDG
ncbi:hypothetical protein NW768_005947 [Fusarium equiseti]|uniref:Uncharacterized protein n=1 Tax=Fusarium equiseti TaxID=61235 RepID=A0ABQ8RDB2_FUSEQ|nr:hypothetical protein NW768_005947 [Fusarium equiseti]